MRARGVVGVPEDGLRAGDLLLAAGNAPAAAAAYQQAAPVPTSAASAWRLGRLRMLQGDVDGALAAYDVEPGEQDALPDVVQLLGWRATAHFLHGDREQCRRDAARAGALAPAAADDSATAVAHTALAMLAALDGDRRANELHYDTALRHAQAAGDVLQQLRIQANRGSRLLEEGDYAGAVEELDDALALPGAHVYPTYEALALTNRGEAAFRLGRMEEAVADLGQARSLFQAAGSRLVGYPIAVLGDVHRARGESALARLAYEEVLRDALQTGHAQSAVPALAGLAFLLVDEDPESAAEHPRPGAGPGGCPGLGAARPRVLLVAQALGETEAARGYVAAAAAGARLRRDRPGLAESMELEATLDDERAGGLLEQALTVWRSVSDPIGEARTMLRLAAVTGPDRALGLAVTAEQTLRAAGARGLADTAAQTVARLESGAPAGTAVRCLGAFRVLRDGSAVPTSAWGSRKPRDLLKLLVSAHGGPQTREQLIDVLWPGQPASSCAPRLSVALSVLRRVLDPARRAGPDELLVADRRAVRLDVDALDVDVERFLRLARQGQRDHEGGRAGAALVLGAAEVLYRGDFLPEDRYEQWAEPVRDEAREAYSGVLRSLALLARAAGDDEGVLRRGMRLLEVDAYDEEAHLAVVRALVRRRRHGEARRRYETYRLRMAELSLPAEPFPGS